MNTYGLTRKQVSVVGIGVLLVGVIALSAVSMGAFAQQDTGTINETEPNDNRSNAQSIPTGEEVQGAGAPNDTVTDWYAFNATADTAINIEYGGPAGAFALYGPDGELIQNETSGTLDRFDVGGVAETNGTYYVRVGLEDFVGGDLSYYFTVETATPDAFEPNDDLANATPLESGEEVSGNLTRTEADWFAIDAEAGETADATLTVPQSADPGQNARIDLFGPDGERLNTGEDNATEYSGGFTNEADGTRANIENQTTTAEQAGTYYVRLTGVENLGGFIEYELTAETSGESTTTTTEGTTTTAENGIVDRSFNVTGEASNASNDTAAVSFDDQSNTVTINGTIVGSEVCTDAILESATYDNGTDTLEVVVGINRTAPANQSCGQTTNPITYQAAVEFSDNLPGTVEVVHQGQDGETQFTTSESSAPDEGGNDTTTEEPGSPTTTTTVESTDTTTEETSTTTEDTATEQPTTTTTTEEGTGSGDGKAKQPDDGDDGADGAADGGNGKSKMGSDGGDGDAADGGNGKSKSN